MEYGKGQHIIFYCGLYLLFIEFGNLMWTEYFWEFHHIVQNSFESEYFAYIVVVPSFGNNDDIVKNFNSFNQSFSFSSTMTCLKFFRNESHLHIPMRSYLTETYRRKKIKLTLIKNVNSEFASKAKFYLFLNFS